MNKLNKYQIVFVLHVILFLVFAASINIAFFTDYEPKPTQLFGISIPLEFFFALGFCLLLLALIIFSWRGAVDAPTQRLKNYFRTFRWLGPGWLIFNLGLLTANLWERFHIQSLFKLSPK